MSVVQIIQSFPKQKQKKSKVLLLFLIETLSIFKHYVFSGARKKPTENIGWPPPLLENTKEDVLVFSKSGCHIVALTERTPYTVEKMMMVIVHIYLSNIFFVDVQRNC